MNQSLQVFILCKCRIIKRSFELVAFGFSTSIIKDLSDRSAVWPKSVRNSECELKGDTTLNESKAGIQVIRH